jgi:hypothetical protein
MTISARVLKNTLVQVTKSRTLLDMCMTLEKVFDDLDMYAYANWEDGEILEGPVMMRHWMEVKLLYPYEKMPEPEGAKRLLARKILVQYNRNVLREPRPLKSSDDVEVVTRPDGSTRRRAKTQDRQVWVVTVRMPRWLVDEFRTDIISLGNGEYLDTEALNAEGELLAASLVGGSDVE